MASEAGVLPIPAEKIVKKWRLQPGKMLLIDLKQGRIVSDEEIKAELAQRKPLQDMARAHPDRARGPARRCLRAQDLGHPAARSAAGLRLHPGRPEAAADADGHHRPGSRRARWAPTRRSRRSRNKSKLLYTYFKQNFAQVTNPPIDSIREELVMSLVSFIGPRPNVLDLSGTGSAPAARSAPADPHQRGSRKDPRHRRHGGQPVPLQDARHHLSGGRRRGRHEGGARPAVLRCRDGRPFGRQHHHPLRSRHEPRPGGDPCPAGDGRRPSSPDPQGPPHLGGPRRRNRRSARNPPLLRARRLWRRSDQPLSRVRDAARHEAPICPGEVDEHEIIYRYIKAIGKGILKVTAKMGISTYQSYCGAQIFDAVGLTTDFVNTYFTGTATTIEGAGLAEIAEETVKRHHDAFGNSPGARRRARYRRRLCLPPARRSPCLALGNGARPCSTPRVATRATATASLPSS